MQYFRKILKSDFGIFCMFLFVVCIAFFQDIFGVVSYLLDNSLDSHRYINSYDSICQHIIYHKEYFRLLDAGTPFAWDWNLFLGSNFFVTKAYYLVGDGFTYLTYILDFFLNSLEESMFFIMLLKIAIGGFSFYLLLKKVEVKKIIAIAFGVLYMFSGWQSTFLEHTMYTSFYAFIPLFFLGLETILKEQKYGIFMVSVLLLTGTNYYLLWPVCVFGLGYWVARYTIIHSKLFHFGFVKSSLKTLLSFLLMLGLISVVWLPSLLHMLTSTRMGVHLNSYSVWSFETIVSMLTNFLSPTFRDLAPIFDQGWYYFNQIGLYVGMLPLVLMPSLLVAFKDKKKTAIYCIWVALCFLILLSPKIGLLFHFTYSLRYVFITSFSMLFISACIFSNIKKFNLVLLWSGVFLILAVYVYIRFKIAPSYYGEEYVIWKEIGVLDTSAMLAIAYGVILSLYGRVKFDHKYITVAVVFVLIYEVSSIGADAIRSTKIPGPEYTFLYGDTYSEFEDALININEADEGFYRIYSDIGALNEQLYTGLIKGLLTYDSVYQYQLRDFLEINQLYPDTNWIYEIDTLSYFYQLGVKYIVTYNQDAYKYESFVEGGRVEELSTQNITVLKLKEPPLMARTYNTINDIREPIVVTQMGLNQTSEVLKMLERDLMVEQSLIDSNTFDGYIYHENYVETRAMPTSYDTDSISFNIQLYQDSPVYFAIPYDKGWTLYSDGVKVETFSGNGGFVCALLSEGTHEIVLEYSIVGFNLSLGITGLSILGIGIWIYLNKMKRI